MLKKILNTGISYSRNLSEEVNILVINLLCFLSIFFCSIIILISIGIQDYFTSAVSLIFALTGLIGLRLSKNGKSVVAFTAILIEVIFVIPAYIYIHRNNGTILYLITTLVILSFLHLKNRVLKAFLVFLVIASFLSCLLITAEVHEELPVNRGNVVLFVSNILLSVISITAVIGFFSSRFKSQQDHLESLNVLKNKLISVISHDIRSPLNNLSGLLEMRESGVLNEEGANEFIDKVRKEITSTSALLNEILLWVKGQMEGLEPNKKAFNLSEILERVIEQNRGQIEKKHISIEMDAEDIEVYADKEMIHVAVRNVFSNAMKFTNQNDGLIQMKVFEKEDYTHFAVTDNGNGLTQSELRHMQKGEVFSDSKGSNEKGFGIGLMLTREFLTHNAGKLKVKNNGELGAEFMPMVPLKS